MTAVIAPIGHHERQPLAVGTKNETGVPAEGSVSEGKQVFFPVPNNHTPIPEPTGHVGDPPTVRAENEMTNVSVMRLLLAVHNYKPLVARTGHVGYMPAVRTYHDLIESGPFIASGYQPLGYHSLRHLEPFIWSSYYLERNGGPI